MQKDAAVTEVSSEDSAEAAAAKKVATEIRAEIISGRLRPGAPLREISLTKKHGASRYTVRSALRELEISGLAESRRYAGYRVRALTRDDVKDIFAVRLLLEAEAARKAMDRPDTWPEIGRRIKHLNQLEARHIEATHKGDDSFNAASLEADLAVHVAIVEASGSTRLVAAYKPLLSELRLCLGCVSLTNSTFSAGHHDDLLMAIQSGDAVFVASAFRRHMTESLTDILAQFVDSPR